MLHFIFMHFHKILRFKFKKGITNYKKKKKKTDCSNQQKLMYMVNSKKHIFRYDILDTYLPMLL